MTSREWYDRVVMITHIDGPVTQDSMQQKFAHHGAIVKSYLTKSGTGKPLGYLTFLESRSVASMLRENGKERQRNRVSWLAKVPETGEWNKWVAPTSAEAHKANKTAAVQAQETQSVAAGIGSAHDLGLDPLELFFVDGRLTRKEKEAKLEVEFGPASRSFPTFPVYIANILKAAQTWFPLCIERGEDYDDVDSFSQQKFIEECTSESRLKRFLAKADPTRRVPEIVLRRKLDLVRGILPPVQPRPPSRPASATQPDVDPTDPRVLVLRPICLSAKSLALVLSLIALVHINPEDDFVPSSDGSNALVRFRTVEHAERSYAVVNKLELPWNNERIRLFRSRRLTPPGKLAGSVHLNLASAISVAAAYNSLERFGSIESCRRAPMQDGQSGIIIQYEEQESLRQLKGYYDQHVDARDNGNPDAYPFHNRGELAVWRVDTSDKFDDLLRQWNEHGIVEPASKDDLGDRFVAHNGPTYAKIHEVSTWKKIVNVKWRADNTEFLANHSSLLRDPKRDKKDGSIKLKIVPYGDLPVPLPLALTAREYGIKDSWIVKWTPTSSDAPSRSSSASLHRENYRPSTEHVRNDDRSDRLLPLDTPVQPSRSRQDEDAPLDEDVTMSYQEDVTSDVSGAGAQPEQSTEVDIAPEYIPPRRARAQPRVRPTPVAFNLRQEAVQLVLSEIRKNKPSFTYNEAVELLWNTPWLEEQAYAKVVEKRKAQLDAEDAQRGAPMDGG